MRKCNLHSTTPMNEELMQQTLVVKQAMVPYLLSYIISTVWKIYFYVYPRFQNIRVLCPKEEGGWGGFWSVWVRPPHPSMFTGRLEVRTAPYQIKEAFNPSTRDSRFKKIGRKKEGTVAL